MCGLFCCKIFINFLVWPWAVIWYLKPWVSEVMLLSLFQAILQNFTRNPGLEENPWCEMTLVKGWFFQVLHLSFICIDQLSDPWCTLWRLLLYLGLGWDWKQNWVCRNDSDGNLWASLRPSFAEWTVSLWVSSQRLSILLITIRSILESTQQLLVRIIKCKRQCWRV